MSRFYWPGCKAQLKMWCRECVPCAKAKGSPCHRARLKPMTTGSFNERAAIDLCGPFPEANDGSLYMMVITEHFSKYVILVPMKTKTAQEAANAIVNRYITVYGAPLSLHSDQAAEYNYALFSVMCRLLHIDKTRSSPHHPSGDGQAERTFRSMLSMLKCLVTRHEMTGRTYCHIYKWPTIQPCMNRQATPRIS